MPKILITNETLPDILLLIGTWTGKLTWNLLCQKISQSLGVESVERQSLANYKEIQDAYSKRKQEIRDAKLTPQKVSDDVTVEYLKQKLVKLEAEVDRLKATNERYKQRFALWQYNAHTSGVRVDALDDVVDILNKPLVQLNRKKGG